MADLEVENTLREIRERVLADVNRRATASGGAAAMSPSGADAAGAGVQGGPGVEALARMDANLATTSRAWSRLPPLLSYRRGAGARFELWLKRLVKRAAHWFTWEQVNFNAAVHHALGDARAALAAHEQALTHLRSELRAESEAGGARFAELQSRLAQAEARFESGGAQLRQALAGGLERLADEQSARASELHAELRGRLDGLLEEQRVCFRQLSLEAGEAAVMHDRARRQLEARLEALEAKDDGR